LILLPELAVPLSVLITGDLSVFGRCVKAGVAEVLLQHSHPLAGVIVLHSVNGEGISQTVRADTAFATCGRIHQVAESGPMSAIVYYLPGAVAIDAKDQKFAILDYRAAAGDEIFKQSKGIVI